MLYDWMETLFAYIRGLPEGAQFFFWLAVILLGLALLGAVSQMMARRHRGNSLLDMRAGRHTYKIRKPTRKERRALKEWQLYWRLKERELSEFERNLPASYLRRLQDTGCIYGDPLHNHHDGCPSCWSAGRES